MELLLELRSSGKLSPHFNLLPHLIMHVCRILISYAHYFSHVNGRADSASTTTSNKE